MIIVLPYRAPEAVKLIESSFENINLEGLGLESARYLNTKELTEEERQDRSLDFLCGFEIMDSEFRMFVVEGLGGPGHAMDKFYKANERSRPNDKKFKMLYNPTVRYKNRMYMDFNAMMKRIRMRDPLTKIMGSPDVYLRSKVPEDMYDTMQKFAEMRKLDRATIVRDFNLFPIPVNLLTLERKYGDALSFEDINGFKQRKRRKTRDPNTMMTTDDAMTDLGQSDFGGQTIVTGLSKTDMASMGKRNGGAVTMADTTKRDLSDFESDDQEPQVVIPKKFKADTDTKNMLFEQSIRQRTMVSSQNYLLSNKTHLQTLSQNKPPKPRIDLPDHIEYHPYGN